MAPTTTFSVSASASASASATPSLVNPLDTGYIPPDIPLWLAPIFFVIVLAAIVVLCYYMRRESQAWVEAAPKLLNAREEWKKQRASSERRMSFAECEEKIKTTLKREGPQKQRDGRMSFAECEEKIKTTLKREGPQKQSDGRMSFAECEEKIKMALKRARERGSVSSSSSNSSQLPPYTPQINTIVPPPRAHLRDTDASLPRSESALGHVTRANTARNSRLEWSTFEKENSTSTSHLPVMIFFAADGSGSSESHARIRVHPSSEYLPGTPYLVRNRNRLCACVTWTLRDPLPYITFG
ncbi:hypothetical protein C8R45DRAFT_939880 [Mycena sanguinolenta]|nr:hypothetical protein C8R45DRAFT_939880 [Mycena sanguinolenta]